jgi:hypothetical protein
MEEYQIQANTRHCAATGRVLKPGEKFYSVLLEEKGQFLRQDFGVDAWKGPPPQAFSFWTGRVAAKDAPRKIRKDDDVLLACLQRLENATDPDQLNFRYVVALLLLRNKRLQSEGSRKDGGCEVLRLRCSKTGDIIEVLDRKLTDLEIAAVRDKVLQVVGWE